MGVLHLCLYLFLILLIGLHVLLSLISIKGGFNEAFLSKCWKYSATTYPRPNKQWPTTLARLTSQVLADRPLARLTSQMTVDRRQTCSIDIASIGRLSACSINIASADRPPAKLAQLTSQVLADRPLTRLKLQVPADRSQTWSNLMFAIKWPIAHILPARI